jgi:hypothetical protein
MESERKQSEPAATAPLARRQCPGCGHDWAYVGFSTSSVQTEAWMLIQGRLMRVATTLRASDVAHCNCGERLPAKAMDLMRAMWET